VWTAIIDSLNSPGGGLLACLALVVLLMPFLFQNNQKAWEALTFILGVIGGLVRSSHPPPEPPKPDQTSPPAN